MQWHSLYSRFRATRSTETRKVTIVRTDKAERFRESREYLHSEVIVV